MTVGDLLGLLMQGECDVNAEIRVRTYFSEEMAATVRIHRGDVVICSELSTSIGTVVVNKGVGSNK